MKSRPKTCGECECWFKDGSCLVFRDIETKAGSRACKEGVKKQGPQVDRAEQGTLL